ncbi:hypothetical protein, partial [Thiolapillus sp.]
VTRDLEGLFQMGLQTQAPPMTTDGGSVNTQLGCRLAGAPKGNFNGHSHKIISHFLSIEIIDKYCNY